jgi:hypothetical protein
LPLAVLRSWITHLNLNFWNIPFDN